MHGSPLTPYFLGCSLYLLRALWKRYAHLLRGLFFQRDESKCEIDIYFTSMIDQLQSMGIMEVENNQHN